MTGLNSRRDEPSDRFILKKMRDEVELLIDETQTVEHHGFDRMAGGHNAHCRGLLRCMVDDIGDPEFFKHARDKARVI